jgi:hypothetical protein
MPFNSYAGHMQGFGDMMIESQDVDMSLLGLDMGLQWFDPFPANDGIGGYFDDPGGGQSSGGAPS